MERRKAWLGIAGAVVAATLLAAAGSDGGVRVGAVPVFALCVAVAFVINWAAFLPAYAARTERFYDLVGSVTYLTVIAVAVALSPDLDARAILVALLVALWAIRLGSFLYLRIRAQGRDARFDRIKTDPVRFLMAWTIQALWVALTASAALAIITGETRRPFDGFAAVGAALWLVGFSIEVVADRQKSRFRSDPANRDRFISTGLWAWSRHPNYFGEIVLWTGIAIMALPVLSGWRWLTLVSPIFVALLLTRGSGIPILEARAEDRWSSDPEYRQYRDTTPVLIPRPPRR